MVDQKRRVHKEINQYKNNGYKKSNIDVQTGHSMNSFHMKLLNNFYLFAALAELFLLEFWHYFYTSFIHSLFLRKLWPICCANFEFLQYASEAKTKNNFWSIFKQIMVEKKLFFSCPALTTASELTGHPLKFYICK